MFCLKLASLKVSALMHSKRDIVFYVVNLLKS